MGEIGLIIMTFFAFIGWALFYGMYLKYREPTPYRVFKVPIGYRFAIIPLVESDTDVQVNTCCSGTLIEKKAHYQ